MAVAEEAYAINTRSQTEPLVKLENVTRSFFLGSEEVKALRGVSLEIHPGRLYVIKGPSGSGKTTMVNIMGGLDHPDSGVAYYKGRDLKKLSDSALTDLRRRDIGFVFQSFALIEVLTAYENVELPLRMVKLSAKERARRVREALDLVSLGKRAQHRAYEMSGGEQQRVAIARAMVNQPSLILADEPTGELNQETAHTVMGLFTRLVREHGRTVCVVTHDPLVCEYADVTFEVVDGRIVGESDKNA